ncbi:MAG TPA: M18 family aminopeptidase [Candidatus Syntrophosphaera sp.]|nr:M18 family aminopeptidase [Candidatus Syntrophosphaera sp.]
MPDHIQDLLAFLDGSTTAVQASGQIISRLQESGFTALAETDKWKLKAGGKHYVCRETSVVAFVVGSQPLIQTGFQLAAAHIDSPGFKLKPESIKTENNVTRIVAEVYGGPIISTWTDRELGIAGRVTVKRDGVAEIKPVDLQRPVAIIPNVAIHLNREVNKGFEYNKQNHLQAILDTGTQAGNPLLAALAEALQVSPEQIAEMELFLYDYAKAVLGGLQGNLVISGRLDNLGMSHIVLSAIRETEKPQATCVAALYDHEEIGSQTEQGAGSSLLGDVLERIGLVLGLNREEQLIAQRKSFLISGDMAHAFHPSYPEKYDASCSPVMNGGPVIKWNASYKYASTAASSQRFASLCAACGVKYQKFAMRSDLLCGSTVGPIIAAQLGISVVDVGNPLWAMHSVRETAGTRDHNAMVKVLKQYYQ